MATSNVGRGKFSGDLVTTRKIKLPIYSRYRGTRLLQIVDDLDRRSLSTARRIVNQVRNLPNKLANKVTKRLNSFVWGVWKQLPVATSSNDTIHTVTQYQGGRLDTLALKYYGNPNFWWVIAQENQISDPLKDLTPGTRLRIPSYRNVMAASLDSSTQPNKTFIEGVAT